MAPRLRSGGKLFLLGVSTGLALAAPLASERASGADGGEVVAVEPTGPTERAILRRLDETPDPGTGSVRAIAQRALGFTVHIRGGSVYGAGVVLDERGHVVTADHVIDGVKTIHVSFHGQTRRIPAKVVDRDAKLDLALLKIEERTAAVAEIGSIADVRMGDEVFGMGSPRKLEFSLSRGIVSYVGRSFDSALYLQTDLPANSGNSGGPIMNERGEVIGIASFILKNSQGLAFSVPIENAFVRFAKVLGRRDTSRFERWAQSRRGGPAKR